MFDHLHPQLYLILMITQDCRYDSPILQALLLLAGFSWTRFVGVGVGGSVFQ